MMNTSRLALVRCLLLAQLFFAGLYLSLSLTDQFTLDGTLGAAQAQLERADMGTQDWLLLALAPACLLSMFGLWRGRVWGRTLYTLLTALMVMMVQSTVQHPVESMLSYLTNMTEGAMLALLWAPAVSTNARDNASNYASNYASNNASNNASLEAGSSPGPAKLHTA